MSSSSKSIVGHRSQLATLALDLKQGNVAHAYLFTGPRHVGKFTVARWFAAELLGHGLEGDKRQASDEQVERLIHPDLLALDKLWMEDKSEDMDEIAKSSNVPQQHRIKSKAKTDTISIDDVRALQERLHEVVAGEYRCCLIRSVERMQAEAVNALLKILEEPPAGVVFLLTTQAMSSLLPTLVSRCRVLRFSRVPDAELQPLLEGASQEDRRFLLALAQGAPGDIRRLRGDQEHLKSERAAYAAASEFWESDSVAARLRILAPLHERTEEADRLLFHLALALRDELSNAPPHASASLHRLMRGLKTNVSRQLLAQQFSLKAGK